MNLNQEKKIRVENENDFLNGRALVREIAKENGFSITKQTKITTAASEIIRNMLVHGGGGTLIIRKRMEGHRIGVEVVCQDRGKGVVNTDLVMQKGYSTINSLGLGLPGAKNLVDEFEIKSELNKGTVVKLIIWML